MKPFRIAITPPHTKKVPPEMWVDVITNTRMEAVQKAIDFKNVKPEDLPIEIHIGKGRLAIHDTGVPMITDTYTIDKEK